MAMVKSAARALELLELLAGHDGPLRLNVIVRELSLPKSSTYGLLSTLVERGYVVRDQNGAYDLIPSLRSGFRSFSRSEERLRATAIPVLSWARDESGETMYVGLPKGNGDVRVLAKVVSKQPIRYDSITDEQSNPGYATMMGRLLLAFMPPEEVDAYFARTKLVALTEHTLTDEAAIRAHLDRIREEGAGVMVEEYTIGGCGVAAPLRDRTGKVVAAVDIAVVTTRFAGREEAFLDIVRQAAREIERRMGWRELTEEGKN